MTLTSQTGSRTATTDAEGRYRFPALDPGSYAVAAQMNGFRGMRQESITLATGNQLAIDFEMKLMGITETVDVVGEAAVVDVSSSSTSNTVSQDLLYNMPLQRSAINVLNYAPGVNNSSAYGGEGGRANALLFDGVDSRDPAQGAAWLFFNFNVLQDVQILGLGQPAEYGAFTGAVINGVTRSGGNQFSGLFDAIYTKSSLASKNITPEILAANPSLGAAGAVTNKLLDVTGQLSGPIVRDKAFFFLSVERFQQDQDPLGPLTLNREVDPRVFAKVTYQVGPSDHLTAGLEYDSYNIKGRIDGPIQADRATDDLTRTEDAPEYVWNLQWRHLLSAQTYFEAKYLGWWGYFDLNPVVQLSRHHDNLTDTYTGSNGASSGNDRGRNQANLALTRYASGLGSHTFKVGAELERSTLRNRTQYVGGVYFEDNVRDANGLHNYVYSDGRDINGRIKRTSFYAQDGWKPTGRLTLNLGLRFDAMRGSSPDVAGTIYSTNNLAPRVGVAWNLGGNNQSVLKAHYGQYYEAMIFSYFDRSVPGSQDVIQYEQIGSNRVEVFRTTASKPLPVADNIKHPRVDEFTVGFERALSNQLRLSVNGIWRENKNFLDSVLPSAQWQPVALTSTLGPVTGYRLVSPRATLNDRVIANLDGYEVRDGAGNLIGTYDAFRTYKGVEFVLSKRLSSRWQAQVSYVLSKAEGTVDNASGGGSGNSGGYEMPFTMLMNGNGVLTNDRRHEVKVFASYQVPVIDLGINAYFRSLTGRPYNAYQRFAATLFNLPAAPGSGPGAPSQTLRIEPRGTRNRATENLVDLRLEKIFTVGAGKDRVSAFADISNLFNSSIITGGQQRVDVPTLAFDSPTAVTAPRQVNLGVRWSF
jgi:hypothetical protein